MNKLKHNIKKIDIQQSVYLFNQAKQMNAAITPKIKTKMESKDKQESIVEKMEGGILVRRYKGKKVDVET